MDPHKHVIYQVANCIGTLVGAVMAVCWFALVADIARRLPSRGLRIVSHILMVVCALGFVAGFAFSLLQVAMAVTAMPPALPYAMEEGIVPGQYLVFEEDGSMVRTTTVPSSMLAPPAKRPPWLEKMYVDVATMGALQLFSLLITVSVGGQLIIAVIMTALLHIAIRKDRAIRADIG
jgi:hypothetical protein